jgi:amino acid transporter
VKFWYHNGFCNFFIIGFEATAIYAEECENPETIGRATFIAVSVITLFYAFAAWALVQYIVLINWSLLQGDPGVLVTTLQQRC